MLVVNERTIDKQYAKKLHKEFDGKKFHIFQLVFWFFFPIMYYNVHYKNYLAIKDISIDKINEG